MQNWTRIDGFDVCTDENGIITKVTRPINALRTETEEYVPIKWSKTRERWEEAEGVKLSTFRPGYSRGTYDLREKEYQAKKIDKAEIIRESRTYKQLTELIAEMITKAETRKDQAKSNARKYLDAGETDRYSFQSGIESASETTIDDLKELQWLIGLLPDFE